MRNIFGATTMSNLSPSDVGITPEFLRRKGPELARDIVCQLDSASKLAASYGISPEQWVVLRSWPAFIAMVKQANEDLGGPSGTIEKARRRAALAVSEVVVQDMATISGDPKAHARDRIAAANLLADIGGVTAKQQAALAGAGGTAYGGPLIQIVMPGGERLNVGVAPVESRPAIEGEVVSRGDA